MANMSKKRVKQKRFLIFINSLKNTGKYRSTIQKWFTIGFNRLSCKTEGQTFEGGVRRGSVVVKKTFVRNIPKGRAVRFSCQTYNFPKVLKM